jgi:tyrosyl-DNA phosphodiesterase-1
MVEQLPCVVLSRSKLDFIKITSIVHFARKRSYFTFSPFRIRGSQLTDKVRDVYFIQHSRQGTKDENAILVHKNDHSAMMGAANASGSQGVIDLADDTTDEEDRESSKPASRAPKRQRPNEGDQAQVRAAPIKLFCTLSDQAERRMHPNDKNHWSRTQCLTLREMLGFDDESSKSAIEWLIIGNFIINFDFLLDEIPELLSVPQTTVLYGVAETPVQPWQSAAGFPLECVRLDPSESPGTRTNPTKQRIPYGCHHSKFFLVGFSNSTVRVIIHTANLRYTDIHCKAQAAYIQDFPMKLQQRQQQLSHSGETSSKNEFEETLVAYLDTYRLAALPQRIRQYDYSTAAVVLLPSTPGYHQLTAPQALGHRKLRQAVVEHTAEPPPSLTKVRPIICQFSSIGSLTLKYLHELQISMDTGLARVTKQAVSCAPLRLQFVYPTVQEIRKSIEGYRGGSSVPGRTNNVGKPFLQPLFRKWSSSSTTPDNSDPLAKGRNVPHIKTYYQLHHEGESVDWFVVASHNMSKAAWGEVQNSQKYGDRRLFIRSWELGVFVSPQLVEGERLVPWSLQRQYRAGDVTIPLPYSLYPRPYQASDRPWAVDAIYSEPDIFGEYSVN